MRLGSWVFVCICLLVAAALTPAHAQQAGVTLQALQATVSAGGEISFAGNGFTPGERVATWVTTPDQAVLSGGYAYASRRDGGRIEFSFRLPEGALNGRWAMTARGDEGQTAAVAIFDVVGGSEAVPLSAAVSPASGPPGTRFAFAAGGFRDREKISYWVTAPDTSIAAAFPEGAETDGDGRVDLSWTASADAPRGIWVMTMQGITSGTARAIRFEVR